MKEIGEQGYTYPGVIELDDKKKVKEMKNEGLKESKRMLRIKMPS